VVTLWHYTCAHARAELGDAATLMSAYALQPERVRNAFPREHLWAARYIWATTLEEPNAAALGLDGRVMVRCDRTAYRYRITQPERFVPWAAVRAGHEGWAVLEAGRDPSSWWVCPGKARAVYDPVPQPVAW
jgi:hypothetical protein